MNYSSHHWLSTQHSVPVPSFITESDFFFSYAPLHHAAQVPWYASLTPSIMVELVTPRVTVSLLVISLRKRTWPKYNQWLVNRSLLVASDKCFLIWRLPPDKTSPLLQWMLSCLDVINQRCYSYHSTRLKMKATLRMAEQR